MLLSDLRDSTKTPLQMSWGLLRSGLYLSSQWKPGYWLGLSAEKLLWEWRAISSVPIYTAPAWIERRNEARPSTQSGQESVICPEDFNRWDPYLLLKRGEGRGGGGVDAALFHEWHLTKINRSNQTFVMALCGSAKWWETLWSNHSFAIIFKCTCSNDGTLGRPFKCTDWGDCIMGSDEYFILCISSVVGLKWCTLFMITSIKLPSVTTFVQRTNYVIGGLYL